MYSNLPLPLDRQMQLAVSPLGYTVSLVLTYNYTHYDGLYLLFHKYSYQCAVVGKLLLKSS
jgi:hypothetical protein